ncbi:MAG: hypothetical protein AAFU49_23520, partial [Pseudomonadota bacterium]
PAALFREIVERGRRLPSGTWLAATLLAATALVAAAVFLSGAPKLALGVVGGVAAALGVLWLSARGLRWLAGAIARTRALRGRPVLRLSLAAIGGPGGDTAGAVLSLGLGLTTLAAIALVDYDLRGAIAEELPERAPAFFLIDIQSDQHDPVLETLRAEPAVGQIETAPMLRGIVTKLKGVPAAEAEIDPEGAWILRGDRGVSYGATPPRGTELLDGAVRGLPTMQARRWSPSPPNTRRNLGWPSATRSQSACSGARSRPRSPRSAALISAIWASTS